jgi:hypothetical protein
MALGYIPSWGRVGGLGGGSQGPGSRLQLLIVSFPHVLRLLLYDLTPCGSEFKVLANKESLPQVCRGWVLGQRAPSAGALSIFIYGPLGVPIPSPNTDRCLPCARAPLRAGPGPWS